MSSLALAAGLLLAGNACRAAQAPAPPGVAPAPPPAQPAQPDAVPTGAAQLTLAAATRGALKRNPTARAAAQELAQAQARLGQAVAQRRFQVTFSSSGGVSNADVLQPPPNHETFGTLLNTLSIPIPIGSRAGLAVRRAREEVLAAEARYRAARLGLAGQVNTAYCDLLRRQALLQIARENLATAQRQLSDTETRLQAGDVAELDVIRARVPVASAQAALYRAQTDVAVARKTLNALITKSLDNALSIADIPLTSRAALHPGGGAQPRTAVLPGPACRRGNRPSR